MRYEALLTVRQWEIITLLEDQARTIPDLEQAFFECYDGPNDPLPSKASIYMSLRFLEYRGLVVRADWEWPHKWTATDDGLQARDLSEEACLTPSRRAA